jgi:hypothetical protein
VNYQKGDNWHLSLQGIPAWPKNEELMHEKSPAKIAGLFFYFDQ